MAAGPASQRVSDADRAAAVERLAGHCAAGRLTADELDGRAAAALAARTRRDLRRAVRDLPGEDDPDLLARLAADTLRLLAAAALLALQLALALACAAMAVLVAAAAAARDEALARRRRRRLDRKSVV
jgi:hypothetical protein